jgi:hypothetical protein
LDVAIGITTHNGKALTDFSPSKTWMACWENIDGFGFGTGVVIAPERTKKMFEMKSNSPDENQALLITSTDGNGKVTYYAGYGWEKAGAITTRQQWCEYLSSFAREIPGK